jgi:phosphopantothenoylcysteine decarboxylase/phosphopantothenate--cysteine ligase
MKILVTLGATREPIDAVRFISNVSTGKTGSSLSEYFIERGHELTALCAKGAVKPRGSCEIFEFESFTELDTLLQKSLGQSIFEVVIHAAAVSDYSVDGIEVNGSAIERNNNTKLYSTNSLIIKLKQNFKIVERIKEYARATAKDPLLVAFKLTATPDPMERESAIAKLFEHSGADLVVHNDLKDLSDGINRCFRIYSPALESERCESVTHLAAVLENQLQKRLNKRRLT